MHLNWYVYKKLKQINLGASPLLPLPLIHTHTHIYIYTYMYVCEKVRQSQDGVRGASHLKRVVPTPSNNIYRIFGRPIECLYAYIKYMCMCVEVPTAMHIYNTLGAPSYKAPSLYTYIFMCVCVCDKYNIVGYYITLLAPFYLCRGRITIVHDNYRRWRKTMWY